MSQIAYWNGDIVAQHSKIRRVSVGGTFREQRRMRYAKYRIPCRPDNDPCWWLHGDEINAARTIIRAWCYQRDAS